MLKHTFFALSLALSAGTATAAGRPDALQSSLQKLADEARPGQFGIIVVDLDTGVTARVNDDRAYMLMSSFKAPVAAAVLSQVDAGKLRLDRTVHLTPADVVRGSAVPSVGARIARGAADVTVSELLTAAVTQSDNTAVDALLRVLGGGRVVTDYLEGKGVQGMRIDLDERAVGHVFEGLRNSDAPPADETPAQEEARLLRGYEAAIAMRENTTTLDGAATFLRKLQAGELLSPTSTRHLLDLMQAQVIPNRIRAGLPAGFTIADKTGTGASNGKRIAAWNDMAIVTAPNGKRAVVGAFLRDTTSTDEQRAAWFRQLGALVAKQLL